MGVLVRAGEDKMCSDHRNIRAAVVFFIVSMFVLGSALPQAVKRTSGSDLAFLAPNLPSAVTPCVESWETPNGAGPMALAANEARFICETSPAPTAAMSPCKAANALPPRCEWPGDQTQVQLDAMGKIGQKISRARERVLGILQTENSCRAWFQGKDSNPAATFRTLRFVLDFHGDELILENRDLGPMNVFRSPYVARVTQGDGADSMVTINAKGAFFSTMARVIEVHKEGGPSIFHGTRVLRVGPYDGDTLPAQVVTLLHEFGHVLDLLPTDEHNVDGRSVQNTNEVLRNCGAALDSALNRSSPSASY